MHANLFGDFIKGNELGHFPRKVQDGIRLHRAIDHYVDHHPEVLKLMRELYPILPKVSGIAVDLFFDHILAKNWDKYHSIPLADFIDSFYNSEMFDKAFFSEEYLFVLEKMKEKNWLYQYQFSYGLMKACTGVSRRISFPNALGTAHHVFEKLELRITETFVLYMQDATEYFKKYSIENGL